MTGKTTEAFRLAREVYPGEEPYVLPEKQQSSQAHWWDGYDGQKVVIINEVSGGTFSASFLCNLLDATPINLPVKGRHVSFCARWIIMTSNLDPKGWYTQHVLDRNPGVIRRLTLPITRVIWMGRVVTAPVTAYPALLDAATQRLVTDEAEQRQLEAEKAKVRLIHTL